MRANVEPLNKGLAQILTRLEVEKSLQGGMRQFWRAYERVPLYDGVLSAVYEVVEKGYSPTEEYLIGTEYKINIFARAGAEFAGVPLSDYTPSESEIVAQVRWYKGEGVEDHKSISEQPPAPSVRMIAQKSGIGDTMILAHLAFYAEQLFENGWRTVLLDPCVHGDNFYLHMRKDDVITKIIVYTADYLRSQYIGAFRHPDLC